MNEERYSQQERREERRAAEPILPAPLPSEPRRHPERTHRPSLFWPLLLIIAGVLLLLSNLGVLPRPMWNRLWQLWPVVLIALGIDVLLGRRSTLAAIVGSVLILALFLGVVAIVFFAQYIPGMINLPSPGLHSEFIKYPLDNLEEAKVTIDWPSFPSTLEALDDSNNLIEANVDYADELIFDVDTDGDYATVLLDTRSYGWDWDFTTWEEKRWEVWLSPNVALDLELDPGSGRCDFDLSELNLSDLRMDSGSGAVDLALPGSSSFTGYIEAGSGRVTITTPEDIGVRVNLEDGSGAFRPAERFFLVEGEADDDGVWETENYDTADYVIELYIDQGSGSITIR